MSGTPLKDGTGIALVFRSLCIKVVGEWRIKIAVLNMEGRQEVEGGETEGAALVGEVLSTVVRVQEGEVDSQAQLGEFLGMPFLMIGNLAYNFLFSLLLEL